MSRSTPRDGGALERQEAETYRKWAEALAIDYPRTSAALVHVSGFYDEREARRADERAERLDWSH